jgi:hypothetical protein
VTLKFTSKEKRDELAERLASLAQYMQSSFDQGHDGRVGVTDEMIGDIKTAACVVGLSEYTPVSECEHCKKTHDSRVACPEYAALSRT